MFTNSSSDLPVRVSEKIIEDDLTGCWLWQASLHSNGYGEINYLKEKWQAHRLVYTLLIGPVPIDLELDHLCRTRDCVNPEHLEPVTHQENIRRGEVGSRTHCPQGHPYNDKNTLRTSDNKRHCKTCERNRMRRNRRGF